MKFSIVIPAHNEQDLIGRVIAALKAQNIDRREFEIIVVDNNSDDMTGNRAIEAGVDLLVKEMKKGTNMARQAGLDRASGDIVAFLDADCQPPPDWLNMIAEDLNKNGVAAVSGPYDYSFSGFARIGNAVFCRFLSIADKLLYFFLGRKAGVIIGGNFAAKKQTLMEIGGLPPLHFWGDDVAIAMIISRKKGRVFFDPKLTVKSSSRRFQKEGILKLEKRYIRAYMKVFFAVDKNGELSLNDISALTEILKN